MARYQTLGVGRRQGQGQGGTWAHPPGGLGVTHPPSSPKKQSGPILCNGI